MDDGLVMSNSIEALTRFINYLKTAFKIKVKEPKYFVGFEIERDKNNKMIKIHQQSYIEKIIRKFGMEDAKIASVPVDPNTKLSSKMCPTDEKEKEEMRQRPYNELLGSLQFAVNMTRPDIAFGVNLLSRFKENPSILHWKAAKQILRYLKGTIDHGIFYKGSKRDTTLLGYSDADWAGDQDDRKSTSGYVLMLNGGPVAWMSKKQNVNALSTLESEYIAAAAAVQEIIWMRELIHFINGDEEMAVLLCDNQGTIKYSENSQFHRRTKHIDNKWNFVKEEIQSGRIRMECIPSEVQLADILTKGVPRRRFKSLKDLLSLHP